MAEPIRPVWRDLIVDEYLGSNLLQFNTAKPTLPLLNPVKQEGTRHNAGRMNNLFYFYNLISVSGTKYKATGLGTSKVTETITESTPDSSGVYRLIMRNISEKKSEGNWLITEEMFDLNEFGENVLVQKRVIEYKKISGDWEATVT